MTNVLTRQIKVLRPSPIGSLSDKTVWGVRHGEAQHNVMHKWLGEPAYTQFQDTCLTSTGMMQAATTKAPKVDLVLVSPLMRTLQTAHIMLPNVRKVALECLKEYPQHTDLCNMRSKASLLGRLYPDIDFADLVEENQPWPNHVDANENKEQLLVYLRSCPELRIAIVSHSTWLKHWMTGEMGAVHELEHCTPYPLAIE
jgi:hypothetical protein